MKKLGKYNTRDLENDKTSERHKAKVTQVRLSIQKRHTMNTLLPISHILIMTKLQNYCKLQNNLERTFMERLLGKIK